MSFFKRNFLFFIVFITGGAVLIIEVTAFRILAPYFGSTLYSTSSIIGVILGALSLGYYFGGVLADKHPRYSLFFSLIILAGVFSLFIQWLSKALLLILGYSLNMQTGPLVLSLILFFIPSLILGMMSPFAIKLKSLEEKEIGRVSGAIFFWSTLGSIVGSFAAGFFLIPSFGINIIIISVGVFLIVTGILGLIFSKLKQSKGFFKKKRLFLFLIFLAFILSLSFGVSLAPASEERIVFQKEGFYNKIIIENQEIADKKARVLKTDNYFVQGGIFLDNDELPFEYTKYYILYKVLNPRAEKALFLGGGAYSTPKKLLSESNNIQKVDVVEIEPELYSLAQKYFGLKEDKRLFNHIADGRRFLYNTDEDYDFIFADVYYSISSIPVHFTTQEFFQLSKDKLSENGFFLMNIIGTLEGKANQLLLSEIKTFRSVFPNSYFFAVDSVDKKGIQNFIFLGLNDDNREIDFSSKEILANENEIIRQLPEKLINTNNLDFSSAYLLTDNFAPTEYLTVKVIAEIRK